MLQLDLCPTRWTVCAEALASIGDNYNALMQTWDAAKDATRDTEMKARIGGVIAQMESFDFFFGVELGRKLLNMVDNFSRSLQSTRLSACERQRIVQTTKLTFQSIRSDQCSDLFWNQEAIKEITSFYGAADLNSDHLQTQLHAMHTCSRSPWVDLDAVIAYLKTRNSVEKEFYCEVMKVARLILVCNACNKCSQ